MIKVNVSTKWNSFSVIQNHILLIESSYIHKWLYKEQKSGQVPISLKMAHYMQDRLKPYTFDTQNHFSKSNPLISYPFL